MSDVVQWLNEIQDLKRQLQAAQQSEAVANASADNWRKRYETEAQQRRQEVESMQQTLDELQLAKETGRQDLPQPLSNGLSASPEIEQRVAQLDTVAELKARLIDVWSERDRLAQALETEKAEHVQTRQNLSMALGDAVDLLTKLKSAEQ